MYEVESVSPHPKKLKKKEDYETKPSAFALVLLFIINQIIIILIHESDANGEG
jgi:hypothetical protein